MTAIIIGAGIAGCCVARMLAERNQPVHVYEQSASVGGVLKTLQTVSIETGDRLACSWLLPRVPMQAVDAHRLVPRCPVARICDHLLRHPRISLMKHTRIVDVLCARRYASHVVSTASPDTLVGMRYGALQWHEGRPIRHPMSLALYWQYVQLLAQEGILWCGSLACFEVLSIPQIIRQAMAITEKIMQPTMLAAQK